MDNDWLEQYLALTEGLPTPRIFRIWAGVSALASVVERKVWLPTSLQQLYPNLFVLLVGRPGVGKSQAIKPNRNLFYKAKSGTILSPTDMTKASFLDVMAASKKRIMWNGQTMEYNPLHVLLTEFGTLVHAHDIELMSTLNDAFDHEPIGSQRRGYNEGKVLAIRHPCLNLLAGTQPHYLGELLPETAWHMGFTARMIMVYSTEETKIDLFAVEDRSELEAVVVEGLVKRSKLLGPFSLGEGAKALFRLWYASDIPPVPEHSRLASYRPRRTIFAMKLAMVSAISRGELAITAEDAERGKSWLLAAEALMPDIFRDMALKSDVVIMNELHRYAFKTWVDSHRDVSKRRALHKSELMRFLALRCPAMIAERILDIMVVGDWFALDPTNPNLYIPRPRGFSGKD